MPFSFTAVPNPGFEFVGWSSSGFETLIALESEWKFHDQGEDLGTEWTGVNFDDSAWTSGEAELGYGDNDENTEVSFGPDEDNKHITTYFRKAFTFDENAGDYNCLLNLRRDDGAVVYLNGEEIARSNLPNGTIDYLTTASNQIGGNDEEDLQSFNISAFLESGINVISAEIHQFESESSDISFDLNFSVENASETVISEEETLTITLNSNASYVAHYLPTEECVLPSEITEDTQLTIDCSPYLAAGDVTVLAGVTLTIDPGVEIWFLEDTRMVVEGRMLANGTEDLPILFKENSEYGAESWGNLSFENSTALNYLDYVEVRNATEGPHPIHNRAAISAWYSTVILDGCLLTQNFSNPIYAEYSDVTLLRSTIHSDVTGDLINVKYGGALINDCEFIGNDQPDTDAIDYDEVINGVIRNSTIKGFYGSNSDGIDLGEQSENVLIELCLIDDCTDKGISIGQSSTALIENNTIVNCSQGLGVKDLGEAEVDHTTFYSNVKAIAGFEKNPGSGGGIVSVTNSIISNSSETPYSIDEYSTGTAENNFYDTDTMPNPSNLWVNPLFENPTDYDFSLQSESPALTAGTDGEHLGNLFHLFYSSPKIMISDIQYFHPLDADQEFIKILNSSSETIDLSGYSFTDGIEFTFPEGTEIAPDEKIMFVRDLLLFPDELGQVFEWTSGQLANEGEKILLSNSFGIVIDHVDYEPLSPWPVTGAENEYISLSIPDLDNHFGANWEAQIYNGIEELAWQNTIHVYPNPAAEILNFSSNISIESYQIYNSSGQLVISSSEADLGNSIQVNSLSRGIYIILINDEHTVRFVKS